MKKLLFLLMMPVIAWAQYDISNMYKVSTGEPYPVVDANIKAYQTIDDAVYMLKIDKKKIILQKYSTTEKKEIYSKTIAPLKGYEAFEEFIKMGKELYFFYSDFDKKSTKEFLYYKKLYPETGEFSSATKVLEIPHKVVAFDKYEFYKSYGENKLVIQTRKKPDVRNDKKSYDEIVLAILDQDLIVENTYDLRMPYTEAEMNNLDYQVDKEGNSYILAEVYDSEVPKKYIKDKKNYHLELLVISNGEISIHKINDSEYSLPTVFLFENATGNLYLAGTYNSEHKYDNIEGFFYQTIYADGSVGEFITAKIPKDILNQFESERTQKKNEKKDKKGDLDLPNIEMRRVISTSDGGTLLIAEEHLIVSHTSVDSQGRTRTYYTYHYQDIYTMKYNKEGQVEWMKKLPKSQSGRDGKGGMSFKYIGKNDNHYFFFTDNEKNINLAENERPANQIDGSAGVLTVYKVADSDGQVTKSNIVNYKSVVIEGYKKPMPVYQHYIDRIFETPTGMAFEVYKKQKQDVMLHVDF
ncbi:MAG: hypothetical protein JXR60_07120 [Bacteroidales bacterium]|nr:hypothetical protein [Bacteroidales bacterium]